MAAVCVCRFGAKIRIAQLLSFNWRMPLKNSKLVVRRPPCERASVSKIHRRSPKGAMCSMVWERLKVWWRPNRSHCERAKRKGTFLSHIFEFLPAVSGVKVNKRVMEALVRLGFAFWNKIGREIVPPLFPWYRWKRWKPGRATRKTPRRW